MKRNLNKYGKEGKPFISIVICTIGRDSLLQTIDSIAKNSANYKDFELIIISQIKPIYKTIELIKKRYSTSIRQIRHYYLKSRGLSLARNFGIKKSRGAIVAFTDDDCIVDRKWLASIAKVFMDNREIGAVFGQVVPFRPEKNKGLYCVVYKVFNKKRTFSSSRLKRRFSYPGNCMSLRKNVFSKIGYFKSWLGLGSIAGGSEDEEMAYRILRNKMRILVDPSIVVSHNRWLNLEEFNRLLYVYFRSFFAVFSFYALQGDRIALKFLINHLKKQSKFKYKSWLKSLSLWFRNFFKSLRGFHPRIAFSMILELVKRRFYYTYPLETCYLEGFFIGTYFFFKEVIFRKALLKSKITSFSSF